MCFKLKKLIARAVVTAVSVASLSCGLQTGESTPPPLTPSFKGENYACVGQIPENLDAYFKNELSPVHIRAFITCLQRAFTTFAQLTRGRDEGVYTPGELRNFIQANFLRNRYVISDLLLSEFMMIKSVLVGGSSAAVTRGELYAIVAVLDDLRDEAIRLKPHLPLINPELAKKMTAEEKDHNLAERLRRANEALSATIRTFGSRLERSQADYSIDHLQIFLLEFRRFVHWDDHFKEAAPVEAWIKLFKTFKTATVAPFDGSVIHPDDWAPLFSSMWHWYSVFVHYQLGVKGQLVLEDVGLQNLILFAGEIFDLTREAIQKQPDLTLGFDTIVSIFDSARDIGWLPAQLRSASVRRVLQAFTTRIFGDPRVAVPARSGRGLTMDSLASLSADFYRWARTQADLNVVWAKGMNRSVRTPNLQARNYINPGSGQQIAGPRSSEYTDFMRVNQLIEPLFPESKDGGLVRVLLAPAPVREAMGVGQSFTNLSNMLLARTLVGLVFRGYADSTQNNSSWSDGISSDELEQFSEDIRDLGVDLKIVDWRNCNVGARSFAEGNLFTYTSDGVPSGKNAGKLDMREAIQLASYLYSGGSLANEYYTYFSKTCEQGPDDINNLPKVSRACVRRELPKLIMAYDNLPGLRDYLKGQSEAGRAEYIETLLDAVFTTKNLLEDPLKLWVEMNELSTLAVVMHYTESVMVRFDQNVDGFLSTEELYRALPVFEGFIKSFIHTKAPSVPSWLTTPLAPGAFMFILQNGRLPEYHQLQNLVVDGASILKQSFNRYVMSPTAEPKFAKKPRPKLDRGALARAFKAIINQLLDEGPDVNKDTKECASKPKTGVD